MNDHIPFKIKGDMLKYICVQSPFGVFLRLENKESLIVKLVAIKTGCKFSKTYNILEKKKLMPYLK